MGNFRLERSCAVNFRVSRCCFKEPPTKFALLPLHLAPAPRHRKGRDARIRPRDPRQRALPNAHARAHARTPREPSFSREKQSRPSLAFFRRTAVALPRLISLRRTHARNARARSRTGDMVNDGKSSSVWSVEEDAELGQHPRALVPLLLREDGCPTSGYGPARLPVRRARPWVSRFAVRRYGARGPCSSEARATSQP